MRKFKIALCWPVSDILLVTVYKRRFFVLHTFFARFTVSILEIDKVEEHSILYAQIIQEHLKRKFDISLKDCDWKGRTAPDISKPLKVA